MLMCVCVYVCMDDVSNYYYLHVVGVDVVCTSQLHTASGGGLQKAAIQRSHPLRAIPGEREATSALALYRQCGTYTICMYVTFIHTL